MAEGSNKPDATAYMVRDFTTKTNEKRADWTKVGAAWLHKDGNGFNVQLDAVPVGGRLVVRVNKADGEPDADA